MSYKNIYLGDYFSLINIDNTNTPIPTSIMPLGIGKNFGNDISLFCLINIESFNIRDSELISIHLFLFGTNNVGDITIYNKNNQVIDTICQNNLNYEITLNSNFYDDMYKAYIFKMSALSADRYTDFSLTSPYVTIEFNQLNVSSIYVNTFLSRREFLKGDLLTQDDLVVMAQLNDNSEIVLSHFDSSFLTNPFNLSDTSIDISATIGNTTKNCSFNNIIVEDVGRRLQNISYSFSPYLGNVLQNFDYYEPSVIDDSQLFPVIITIHGGDFNGGDKNHYNYISPFLISEGFVHVNMNYRLLPRDQGDILIDHDYYSDMISDIQYLIKHLYENRKTNSNPNGYPIDVSRITLMGHSAGGNLALVYGLSHFAYEDPNDSSIRIPLKAIITEGAPTFSELVDDNNGGVEFETGSYVIEENICSMMKNLLGKNNINDTISMSDIHILQPQEYIDSNNLPSILILMMQGTGCYHVNDQEQQNTNGDSIVPLVDAQVVKNKDNLVNLLPIGLCSHNDYRILFLNNTTVTQGDNGGYRDQIEMIV